jgi:hypothetical protein
MRTEVYRDGAVVEWYGIDGTDWVHWRDGAEIERRTATPADKAADQAAVTAAEEAAATQAAIDTAQAGIDTLHASVPTFESQLASDLAAVQAAGWDALTSDQRTALMVRVLNGFGSAMTGLVDHATVTGAIAPAAP